MTRITLDQKLALLKKVALFANIEESKLKLLAFASGEASFAKGELLFRQGDPSDRAYVIAKGSADAVWEGGAGGKVIAKLEQYDVVGEIALLSEVPSMTTVTATSELTALSIEKAIFLRMIDEYPRIAVAIVRELARVIHRTSEQLSEASAALLNAGD